MICETGWPGRMWSYARRPVLGMTLAGALLASIAVGVQSEDVKVADGFQFTVPHIGTQRIVAVCDAKISDLSCWRPDGTIDPQLTASLKDKFNSETAPSLPIRYGRSTKLIVVGYRPGEAKGYISSGFTTEAGFSGQFLVRFQPDPKAEIQDVYCLYPDEDSKAADLQLSYTTELEPDKSEVPFKVGRSFTLGAWTFEVTNVLPSRPLADFNGVVQKAWNIDYELAGPNNDQFAVIAIPKDSGGKPIGDVNFAGKPVGEGARKAHPGVFSSQTMPISRTFVSEIDPRFIDRLSLKLTSTQSFTYKNVALMPKQAHE